MTTEIFASGRASIAGPWRNASPIDGARWLASLRTPWWISGGWALDLYAGAQSRVHKDLDVGVLRRDVVAAAAALAGWEVFEAKNGVLAQLESGRQPRAEVNSLWCRPAFSTQWHLELMLNDAENDAWVYRRDRRIKRPLASAIRCSTEGIPYLAPEIQLLFKSHALRPQDRADFESILPRLDLTAATWLADALAKVDRRHSWLPILDKLLNDRNIGA